MDCIHRMLKSQHDLPGSAQGSAETDGELSLRRIKMNAVDALKAMDCLLQEGCFILLTQYLG